MLNAVLLRGMCPSQCTDGAEPMHHAAVVLANARRHSTFAAFARPTAPLLPDGAGPMATIVLANAERHSTFAVFFRPTAPTVQG